MASTLLPSLPFTPARAPRAGSPRPPVNGAAFSMSKTKTKNPRVAIGDNSRNNDVERTAEEIRCKFLRDNAGENASHRARGNAVVATDTSLSFGARLTYILRSYYGNSGGEDCSPGKATLAALLGVSKPSIKRYDSELREAGYLKIKRQRRDCAFYSLITPESLQSITAELLPPDQDVSDLRLLNGQEVSAVTPLEAENGSRSITCDPKKYHTRSPTLDIYPTKKEGARANGGNGRTRKGAQKTRLPADWMPSDDDRAYAQKQGLLDWQIDRLAEDFRDYWTSDNAKGGGLKADWPATWRSRVRTVVNDDRLPKRPPRSAQSDIEAEVERLAQSPSGKRRVFEIGEKAARDEFRRSVLKKRGADDARH